MLKMLIGNILAKLLRAAIGRIATDLELQQVISAASESAKLIKDHMGEAVACTSRVEVMTAALKDIPDGFICELGVFKGESLNQIARQRPQKTIYGFDTFDGLPEFWRNGYPEGAFEVSLSDLKFENNCKIYKGLFHETLPIFLEEIKEPAALIHVDCDLYSSTACALDILMPRIQPGTVIVFDEYFNYPGWERHEYLAFNEFIAKFSIKGRYIIYNKKSQQVAYKITSIQNS